MGMALLLEASGVGGAAVCLGRPKGIPQAEDATNGKIRAPACFGGVAASPRFGRIRPGRGLLMNAASAPPLPACAAARSCRHERMSLDENILGVLEPKATEPAARLACW